MARSAWSHLSDYGRGTGDNLDELGMDTKVTHSLRSGSGHGQHHPRPRTPAPSLPSASASPAGDQAGNPE